MMADLLDDLLAVFGALDKKVPSQFAEGWFPLKVCRRHRRWHRYLFAQRTNEFNFLFASRDRTLQLFRTHAKEYTGCDVLSRNRARNTASEIGRVHGWGDGWERKMCPSFWSGSPF
jgi:hypothetical protein